MQERKVWSSMGPPPWESLAALEEEPPSPLKRLISRSMRRRLMVMPSSSIETAASTSCGWNAWSAVRTRLTSSAPSAGTLRTTLKALARPSESMMEAFEVVEMMRSFLPSGGRRLTSTSRAWSTALLKRGPMSTYSRMRSMSSRTTAERVDLYASLKTLESIATLAASVMPTIASALTSLTNGKPLSRATVAASAVVPHPFAPSSIIVSSGVRSDTRTCSTSVRAVDRSVSSLGPYGMTPPTQHRSSSSVLAPNAGFTSSSAASKSSIETLMFSSSIGAPRLEMSTWRVSAKEVALRTKPSSSAPLKFFVRSASAERFTSAPRNWF
mmetsp:Transcript_10387/g.34158  ORF Transcript_10387/g.34158 Transcript_10387/m.34158 type:complete len:326 (+) Transcript_10387:1338-2315(+)